MAKQKDTAPISAREKYKSLPPDHFEIDMRKSANKKDNWLYGEEFNPQPPGDRVKMYVPVNKFDY